MGSDDRMAGHNFSFSQPLQPSSWMAVVAIFAAVLLLKRNLKSQSKKLAPGPVNWPIFGAMFTVRKEQLHRSLRNLAKQYGPVVYFKLGAIPVVLVSSPEIAQELLKQRDVEFASRAHALIMYSNAKYFGFNGQSMGFASYTPSLQQLRKVVTTEVFAQSKLKSAKFVEVRREELGAMVRKIHALSTKGDAIEIKAVAHRMGLNSVSRQLFGDRYFRPNILASVQEFGDLMLEMLALSSQSNITDVLPALRWLDPQGMTAQFSKLHAKQRRILSEILEDFKKPRSSGSLGSKTVVDALLSLEGDEKLTDSVIMGTLSDLLIGGSDTNGVAMEWAMVELLREPEILSKLQAEIDSVVGQKRAVEELDIPNLPYLQAVVKEVLRMHPPLTTTIPRTNELAATQLGGYHIPKHSSILVNIWALARDPSIWERPNEFVPERFTDSNIGFSGTNFQYLPFGSGRRKCVGVSLGQLMAHMTLATLVQAFEFLPLKGKKASDISIEEEPGVTVRPKDHLFLSAIARVSLNIYDQR